MKGEIAQALALTQRLHLAGADPAEMLIELAEFCHFVTRVKLAPAGLADPAISETERRRGADIAGALALGPLTRAWTILLKGVEDVKDSPRPLASAEMAIIRLAYAADLPSPEEALRKLAESGDSAPRLAPPPAPSPAPRAQGPSLAPAPRPAPADAPRLASFADVVALARAKRDVQLTQALERDVRLSRFEPGRVEFSLIEGAPPALVQTLSRKLSEWTGERWMVALAPGATAPTLREVAEAREAEKLSGVAAHPVVRKVLERFPGARIVEVRGPEPAPAPPAPTTDEDVAYADSFVLDDDL
jgi:DNA polymerase-3 subunit gamma/tau